MPFAFSHLERSISVMTGTGRLPPGGEWGLLFNVAEDFSPPQNNDEWKPIGTRLSRLSIINTVINNNRLAHCTASSDQRPFEIVIVKKNY
jgi:hypothetical protein